MEKLIYSCMTKAVVAEGDQLELGPQWITARRARLKLYDDRLQCGNWTINYDEICEGTLASFRSHILRFPGYILSVRTESKTYHFGLNGWIFWKGELPFPVKRIKSRLRMSAISFLARAVLVGYGIYFVWRWVSN